MNQIKHHIQEWQQSEIAPSLIDLNLESLEEEDLIAEWYFGELPPTARRNDGRIRDGYLHAYREPLKGGWGIKGYNPTDLTAEPELRTFKPDSPRVGKNGKIIKYDAPKNSRHNPILPRVSYEIASLIFRSSGLDFLELTDYYAPEELMGEVNENAECRWFWQAVLDNSNIPLSISEGGKKALALLSQGRCAIAVTSITTWRESKGSDRVHPWLALFAPHRRFYLTFDQDINPTAIKAVNAESLRLGRALLAAGSTKVRRISWNGTTKGIDDFIYHLKSKYSDRHMLKILRKSYINARDFRRFNFETTLPGKVKKINKRYLESSDFVGADQFKITVIKSPKNTGKTQVLGEMVQSDRDRGISTINLSHLERLARELGIRLDLPYRTETATNSRRNSFGYSLCIDSLSPYNSIPFHPEQWLDAGICLDEFTQVLAHLTFGSTEVGKYRKLIAETLGQKLADCWERNKPIRLLDADADGESVELIYELIQAYSDIPLSKEELEAKTLTVINEYEPAKGDLHFYHEPSPKKIKADLIEMMKQGKNLLILTSSRAVTSADGSINLEELAKKHYFQKEILRIDSTTTGDPLHPAYNITGKKILSLIENTDIKMIIASPAICTGISLDNLTCFFHAVFSFQSGNITPNSVRQQLVRLRDFQVPRYLWCPKMGLSFVGSKSTNPIELLSDQQGESKVALKLLGVKEAENLIASNICPITKYWAKIGAKQNRHSYYYREILFLDLETEGWQITVHYPEDDPSLSKIWQERKEIKNSSIERNNNAISQAKDLTHSEAKQFQQRKNLSAEEQHQLQKYLLSQKYGIGEIFPELIAADRKKLYSSLQLQFWLNEGREFLKDRDRYTLKSMQNKNKEALFIPDLNQKTYIIKVKLLEQINLKQFSQPGTEWTNKSPEAIALSDFVTRDLIRFNQILGCGIAITDSPITVLQKIFKRIGKKLPYLRNERDGKKRLRIYGAAVSRYELPELERRITEGWLTDSVRLFLKEETKKAS